MNNLGKWSWHDLITVYRLYGRQMQEYAGVAERIEMPKSMNIGLSDQDNIFILRFWRDVRRINAQIAILDAEFARRNNLVGVVG